MSGSPKLRPAPEHRYSESSQTTSARCARLLATSDITYNSGLPADSAIADVLDALDPDDPNGKGPQTDLDNGLVVWESRGGLLQALEFVLTGADGATATAIVGGFRAMERLRKQNGDRIQWIPTVLARLSLTAGTRVGVSGGLVTDSHRYCDTIAVSRTYRYQPAPERLVGPKDTSDNTTLDPQNGHCAFLFDALGLSRLFVYLDLGTATGANVIEYPF